MSNHIDIDEIVNAFVSSTNDHVRLVGARLELERQRIDERFDMSINDTHETTVSVVSERQKREQADRLANAAEEKKKKEQADKIAAMAVVLDQHLQQFLQVNNPSSLTFIEREYLLFLKLYLYTLVDEKSSKLRELRRDLGVLQAFMHYSADRRVSDTDTRRQPRRPTKIITYTEKEFDDLGEKLAELDYSRPVINAVMKLAKDCIHDVLSVCYTATNNNDSIADDNAQSELIHYILNRLRSHERIKASDIEKCANHEIRELLNKYNQNYDRQQQAYVDSALLTLDAALGKPVTHLWQQPKFKQKTKDMLLAPLEIKINENLLHLFQIIKTTHGTTELEQLSHELTKGSMRDRLPADKFFFIFSSMRVAIKHLADDKFDMSGNGVDNFNKYEYFLLPAYEALNRTVEDFNLPYRIRKKENKLVEREDVSFSKLHKRRLRNIFKRFGQFSEILVAVSAAATIAAAFSGPLMFVVFIGMLLFEYFLVYRNTVGFTFNHLFTKKAGDSNSPAVKILKTIAIVAAIFFGTVLATVGFLAMLGLFPFYILPAITIPFSVLVNACFLYYCLHRLITGNVGHKINEFFKRHFSLPKSKKVSFSTVLAWAGKVLVLVLATVLAAVVSIAVYKIWSASVASFPRMYRHAASWCIAITAGLQTIYNFDFFLRTSEFIISGASNLFERITSYIQNPSSAKQDATDIVKSDLLGGFMRRLVSFTSVVLGVDVLMNLNTYDYRYKPGNARFGNWWQKVKFKFYSAVENELATFSQSTIKSPMLSERPVRSDFERTPAPGCGRRGRSNSQSQYTITPLYTSQTWSAPSPTSDGTGSERLDDSFGKRRLDFTPALDTDTRLQMKRHSPVTQSGMRSGSGGRRGNRFFSMPVVSSEETTEMSITASALQVSPAAADSGFQSFVNENGLPPPMDSPVKPSGQSAGMRRGSP